MNNIKVSVIVPVYNVKRYLSECLNSVLDQTLKEIEIICVDDGSTDGCSSILDAYAAEYSHIRVIHKKNSGYGNTMNMGIDEAKGEYIGFVESDDVILPEFYAHLYEIASRENLDLVKSEAIFWWSKFDYKYHLHYKNMEEYFYKVLIDEDRIKMYGFFMNTWSGIYKRSFLLDFTIRHNETPGASYQDNGFWFQTVSYCRRGMWLDDAYYLYRQDNPEASVKDIKKVMAMPNEYKFLYRQLQLRNVPNLVLDMCAYYTLVRNRGNFYRIADTCKKEFVNHMIEEYEKKAYSLIFNEDINNWYINFYSQRDSFCDELLQRKNDILNTFNSCKEIFIYGAGKRGCTIFRKLCSLNLIEKLSGFVVTKKTSNDLVCNQNVFQLDKIAAVSKKSLFLISVSDKSDYYSEMLEELKKYEITNYMECSSLLDDFYSLC